jgi:probable F420-dependent oxidoreductase
MQSVIGVSAQQWAEKARRIEDAGFSILAVTDHLNDAPPDQLAAVPALMAAAHATTTIQVGATVFGNDFRHPVMLAKEAATLDLLTDGRTFVGLGAGWLADDYDQTGIRFERAGVRIARLAEAVAIVKGFFSEGPFSFEGEHYRVSKLVGYPKPIQRPHPPIFIGGGGRTILSLAAREADIVGINANLSGARTDTFFATVSMEGVLTEKIGWIREAAGARFEQLELNVIVFTVLVTDDREAAARAVAARFGSSTDAVLDSPHVLIGTVDQIIETLEHRRERHGISNIIIGVYPALDALTPVIERLAGR